MVLVYYAIPRTDMGVVVVGAVLFAVSLITIFSLIHALYGTISECDIADGYEPCFWVALVYHCIMQVMAYLSWGDSNVWGYIVSLLASYLMALMVALSFENQS